MKTDIHPKYNRNLQIVCSCGNMFIAGSTKAEIKTEICSACHPFYTGQQKLVDTAGRVDKYLARVKKAQKINEKTIAKVDNELDELFKEEASEQKSNEKTDNVVAKKSILKMSQDNEEKEATKDAETAEEEPKVETAKAEKKATKKPVAKKSATKKSTKKAA